MMEASSNGSPHKDIVDSGIDKTLIVSCDSPDHNNASAKMEGRILALENALQELGGHFVKYQADVAGILVQECSRLVQHVNEQRDKIQKVTHGHVQNALSRAHGEIFIELHAEMRRMLESNPPAMGKCMDTMSQDETASTAASENLDGVVELRKLMNEMRKEIHEVNIVLSTRVGATERRIQELDSSISAQRMEVEAFKENLRMDSSLTEPCAPLGRYRSSSPPDCSKSRVSSKVTVISVERQINELLSEQSPHSKLSGTEEVRHALKDLHTTLTKEQLDDSTGSLNRCSSEKVLVDGCVTKTSSPTACGYKAGTCQLPRSMQGSVRFPSHDGRTSLVAPAHGQPCELPPRKPSSSPTPKIVLPWHGRTSLVAPSHGQPGEPRKASSSPTPKIVSPRHSSPPALCSPRPGLNADSSSPPLGHMTLAHRARMVHDTRALSAPRVVYHAMGDGKDARSKHGEDPTKFWL